MIILDLTSKSGFWAKAFNDAFVRQDAVLCYYVNSSGEVVFEINGENRTFFTGVDVTKELWCMLDIYGNTTAIEFVGMNFESSNISNAV